MSGMQLISKRPSSSHGNWTDYLALTVLSVGALCFTARATLAPREPERGAAVVFAPWTAPEAAMATAVEAGARFVRFGGYGFIAVVAPDNRNYTARAMASGAWLVVDPQLLAACLTPFGVKTGRP
jgi:hypothetical protein